MVKKPNRKNLLLKISTFSRRNNKVTKLKLLVVGSLVIIISFFMLALCKDLPFVRKYLPSKTYVITLTQNKFVPNYLTIERYDYVRFVNQESRSFWPASNLHPSHKLYSEFDPKGPISAGKTWTFRFDKAGIHEFHDHLAPDITGVIVVLDGKGNTKNVPCNTDNQSEKCWNDQIVTMVRKSGIQAGFNLFLSLFKKYQGFRDDCHTFTHTLGHEAYSVFYKTKQPLPMSPVLSYCGYGFYHGFLESLAIQTNDIGKIREFCDSLKVKGVKGKDYYQCYHGIGHGSLNRHENIKSEKLQDVIDESLKLCEKVNTGELELMNCTAGVYGPTYNYFPQESKENKALADKQGIISVCQSQKEKYKMWCYDALSKFLLPTNNNDFLKAVSLIRNVGILKYEKISVYQSAVYLARVDHGNPDLTNDIKKCLSLEDKYKTECVTGFEDGLLYDMDANKLNKKAVAFCNNKLLTPQLQNSCKERLSGRNY